VNLNFRSCLKDNHSPAPSAGTMRSGAPSDKPAKTRSSKLSMAQIWHKQKERRNLVDFGHVSVVARDGIEPPTPAFSGPATAIVKPIIPNNLAAVGVPKTGLQLQPNATIGSFRVCSSLFRADGFIPEGGSLPTQLFSKFIRPAEPRPGPVTERDLDLLDAVARYRFSPASELVRLAGGNEDVTHRRLRLLWERGLVSRWAFPGIRTHSQFHYYLDSRKALDLLAERRGLLIQPQLLEEIRGNREKDYAGAALRGQHVQLAFLKHSLMVSRLHFLLEMACRNSGGSVSLEAWRQGSQLAGHKVEVPKLKSSREGGELFWEDSGQTERLPVEPDALFSLRFADRPAGQELAHFCYEADRGTMTTTAMLKKFRAYHHFIKRQQKHKEAFGVHPVRAVLVETTDEGRGRRLMELVNHPLVAGPARRAGLFWFTIAEMFTTTASGSGLPFYLDNPAIVLSRIWALPDRSLHALSDAENSLSPAATAQPLEARPPLYVASKP
jgi:hypothetical protein